MEIQARRAALALSLTACVIASRPGFAETPSIPEPPPNPDGTAAPPAATTVAPPTTEVTTQEPAQRPPPSTDTRAQEPEAPPAAVAEAAVATPAKPKSARVDPSVAGESGLARVVTADGPSQGTVRIGFAFDAFGASEFFARSDELSRIGGTLSISAGLFDWLEAWLGTRATSTRSSLTDPELLQSQGDVLLGVKAAKKLGRVFALGADLNLGLMTGIGESTFILDSSQLGFRALTSLDFQDRAPIRAHLNVGVILDGSENLVTEPLTESERFALGIADFHRFTLGFGLEFPLPYVTPFIEYSVEVPLGYLATPGIVLEGVERRALRAQQISPTVAPLARPAITRAMPQRLTPGARLTALEDFAVTVALELGLTPEHATGVPAVAPYVFMLGASYSFDPFHERPSSAALPVIVPVLVPEVVEAKKAEGDLTGVVTTPDGKPVANALVRLSRGSPAATSEDGRFRTQILEPGPLDANVERDGFKPLGFRVEIRAGEAREISVVLIPEIKRGTLAGRFIGFDGKPLSNVSVLISGLAAPLTTDADGRFSTEIDEGPHDVELSRADLYKTLARVTIKEKEVQGLDRVLRVRPSKPIVNVAADRLDLIKPIVFVGRETKLAPESELVLDAIADVLLSRPDLAKVRVEAHVDDEGPAEESLKLSKERAELVVKALVERGIAVDRLFPEGFGSERPIAPNLTKRGRDKNRRVELKLGD
ncbi:MAG: carboxypeptidase regulatory-like domain-containing protein [Deltaproteobacteria bacterium]|nr:carboxypeptidase regulatory-like domain-containing protein [Deltaproteobacteria bacterium]